MANKSYGHHNYTPPLSPPDIPAPPTPADTSDFAQLGATFNDATRALVGGLWQNAVEEAGQGNGSVFRYVDDLQSVHDGIQAQIDGGVFTGATLANAQKIASDITTAISAAQASVNGGGTFGSVAAAERALHDSHIDVLKTVADDAALSQMATRDGAAGFTAVPPTLDGVKPHNAPHATLAEIGTIFDDAANRILGGVNAQNKNMIANDVHAVITDMKQLIGDHADAFTGLTGVHADAVVRQLQLELSFIKQADTNPVAGRASNDNILDIVDIIQGDENLAQMASQKGVSGFTPFPDALNETPKYQDNEAQTNFWANFIASSNSLGDRAMQLVGNGDKAATHAFVTELKAFEKGVTQFDAAQGGIFEARFDNELLGKNSTLGAEVHAMIQGLKTGNGDLVAAAATEMHANAADVGGNNVAFDGGTYNTDGRMMAEVLSLPPQGPLPAIAVASAAAPGGSPAPSNGANAATTVPPADASTDTAHATQPVDATPSHQLASAAAPGGSTAPSNGANAATTVPVVADATTDGARTTQTVDIVPPHHFEHMWG